MLILGLESSCDETAAALVDGDRVILSHRLAGQEAAHRPYGGVVPEIAARAHVEALGPLIAGALADAGKTLADIGREMEQYRAAGMAGCKFKVGGLAPEEDARRVEAARKAAGPDFKLVVDANRGWNAHDAIRFARGVEHLDIGWFEEPCHWYDDAAQMARVRSQTRIPINAGQSEITSHGVRRMLAAS